METTERIVEAYCRYIERWFTIPNIRLKNNEVDLIAVDSDGKKAHIEVSVSISDNFSKLTDEPYEDGEEKNRTNQAKARTKLGYFEKKKFGAPEILDVLKQYGLTPGLYKKIIVTWKADTEVKDAAKNMGIEVWEFPVLLRKLKE